MFFFFGQNEGAAVANAGGVTEWVGVCVCSADMRFVLLFSFLFDGNCSSFGCSDFAHPLSSWWIVFVSGFCVSVGANTRSSMVNLAVILCKQNE